MHIFIYRRDTLTYTLPSTVVIPQRTPLRTYDEHLYEHTLANTPLRRESRTAARDAWRGT